MNIPENFMKTFTVFYVTHLFYKKNNKYKVKKHFLNSFNFLPSKRNKMHVLKNYYFCTLFCVKYFRICNDGE